MSCARRSYKSISANSHENIIQIRLLRFAHKDNLINGFVCFGSSQRILFCYSQAMGDDGIEAGLDSLFIVNVNVVLSCEFFLDFKKF